MSNRKPFRPESEILADIEDFVATHGRTFARYSYKISTLFEICCYNSIINWYESNKYVCRPDNTNTISSGSQEFRYKLSTSGYAENFSYFLCEREESLFEVRMNIPVQSKTDSQIMIVLDISVLERGGIKELRDPVYYRGKKRYNFIESGKLVTFFECKHMDAFPELLVGFIGMVGEICPECLSGSQIYARKTPHLAPTLMISGHADSFMAKRVSRSLMLRYKINISSGHFGKESLGLGPEELDYQWKTLSSEQMNTTNGTLNQTSEKEDNNLAEEDLLNSLLEDIMPF